MYVFVLLLHEPRPSTDGYLYSYYSCLCALSQNLLTQHSSIVSPPYVPMRRGEGKQTANGRLAADSTASPNVHDKCRQKEGRNGGQAGSPLIRWPAQRLTSRHGFILLELIRVRGHAHWH